MALGVIPCTGDFHPRISDDRAVKNKDVGWQICSGGVVYSILSNIEELIFVLLMTE